MEKREGQGQRAEQRDNKGGRPNSRPKFNRERKEEADAIHHRHPSKGNQDTKSTD